MENKIKINIAELLKGCPRGMELDCAMYEDLYFDYVDELNNIRCYIQQKFNKTSVVFNQDGTPNSHTKSKCVIFPKGKTTWEGFIAPYRFKDGDILFVKAAYSWIIIYKECGYDVDLYKYVGIPDYPNYTFMVYDCNPLCHKKEVSEIRLATEEEKVKLFDAIKDNGYKWNPETKTLEKLSVPSTPEKFYIRIGDIPSEEKSAVHRGDVVVGYEDGVSVYDCVETDGLYRIVMPFPLKEGQGMTYECLIQEITQCRYEIENPRNVYLVSGIEVGKGNDNEPLIKNVKILKDLTEQFNTKNDNTEDTKTLEKLIKPKFKVGDRIIRRDSIVNSWIVSSVNSEYYGLKSPNSSECIGILLVSEQDDYELISDKFDITILKPFVSKVLVRNDKHSNWKPAIFGCYMKDRSDSYYSVLGGTCWIYCIPYEGNEHLLGATIDCDEYYKTWE